MYKTLDTKTTQTRILLSNSSEFHLTCFHVIPKIATSNVGTYAYNYIFVCLLKLT